MASHWGATKGLSLYFGDWGRCFQREKVSWGTIQCTIPIYQGTRLMQEGSRGGHFKASLHWGSTEAIGLELVLHKPLMMGKGDIWFPMGLASFPMTSPMTLFPVVLLVYFLSLSTAVHWHLLFFTLFGLHPLSTEVPLSSPSVFKFIFVVHETVISRNQPPTADRLQ